MTLSSVRIHPGKEYQDSVIQLLEEALRRARAGEISAIALSWLKPGNKAGGSWSMARDPVALLGSMQLSVVDLSHDLLRDSTTTTVEEASAEEIELPENLA